jgi:hypothetical protein
MDDELKKVLREAPALPSEESRLEPDRYMAMRFVASFYRFLGWLVLGASCVGIAFAVSEENGRVLLISILALLIAPCSCFFMAEAIILFLDIENNSRNAADALRMLTKNKDTN